MVVSDSLGAPGAVSGARGLSQQMAVCRGDLLGLLVSHFPAGFCFPQLPTGWFPRICLSRSLLHVSSIGLSTWSPLRQCTGACAVGHGCCLLGWFREAVPAGHWGFCLCVSSLTPLPLLSVLLFCLNGADALLLGGLLSSFQAFGFGVYCFSFSPPCVNRHSVGSRSDACTEGV